MNDDLTLHMDRKKKKRFPWERDDDVPMGNIPPPPEPHPRPGPVFADGVSREDVIGELEKAERELERLIRDGAGTDDPKVSELKRRIERLRSVL